MLILTRNVGEKIIIGNDIEIIVKAIRGYQVVIGVNAPENISVHREEIFKRIKAEEI